MLYCNTQRRHAIVFADAISNVVDPSLAERTWVLITESLEGG